MVVIERMTRPSRSHDRENVTPRVKPTLRISAACHLVPMSQPSVLTIAGSDSGGGAGIQADLKTFAAHGCYGTSAITALTAQNTKGVQDVFPSSPEFLEKQIDSILSDIDIKGIKSGMLFDANNTRAAISALKKHYLSSLSNSLPPFVVDPVCVSTSGHSLLDPAAIDVLLKDIFPMATLITPNKAEAELLLSRGRRREPALKIESIEDMLSAAEELAGFGSQSVLLKGGHLTVFSDDVQRVVANRPDLILVRDDFTSNGENMEILRVNQTGTSVSHELVVDVLYETSDKKMSILCRPRIRSTSTHGTGCTLSAAIAARLALGSDLTDAVKLAARYTHLGIETANPEIGHGHGPLNHFHSLKEALIPGRTPGNPYPLTTFFIRKSAKVWKAYVEHDFVKLLGRGILPKECFVRFIKQDYLYLRYYARAYALLAAKSSTFASISSATQTILSVLQEINTHKTFCSAWGISEEELEYETREEAATAAYGGYLIDVGLRGDSMMLLIALLSCLLGYGEVGLWLKRHTKENGRGKGGEGNEGWVVLEGNPYVEWIKDYSGEAYQQAVKLGLETIESRAAADPPSKVRLDEWFRIWERCTEFEKGFWDMAMVKE
ncbi:hypothetical protein D9757_010163 [Collybiopsis confluens]|uniref:Phosphomethylpyrimidine kinase n=1 Tax=Collybiopsis confluens TaxID=2823264 RepID=A0A8H5H0R6_9AGAR|nr:hypothetical protein D9757_010163 [Collybiopsis confluens]